VWKCGLDSLAQNMVFVIAVENFVTKWAVKEFVCKEIAPYVPFIT
jgi:hypothetical protein